MQLRSSEPWVDDTQLLRRVHPRDYKRIAERGKSASLPMLIPVPGIGLERTPGRVALAGMRNEAR